MAQLLDKFELETSRVRSRRMYQSRDREVRRIVIGKMYESTRTLFVYGTSAICLEPTAVAARFKVWVCGRSLAGIASSNSAEGVI
jgi:hypothetical protein